MATDELSTSLPETDARSAREHPRRSVLWPARLIVAGRRDIRCFVIDLANGGARLRAETPVPVGTFVKLRSARLARRGYVVWSGDGCVGLRFTEALDGVVKAFDLAPS